MRSKSKTIAMTATVTPQDPFVRTSAMLRICYTATIPNEINLTSKASHLIGILYDGMKVTELYNSTHAKICS